MTPEQKAAYIMAMAANAYAETTAMISENNQSFTTGKPAKYKEADFEKVAEKHGITHNQVCQFFAPEGSC